MIMEGENVRTWKEIRALLQVILGHTVRGAE
jgi:hypothetical protein